MHDIKKIREFPTELDEKLAKRNIPAVSSLILKLDKEKRKLIQSVEDVQSHLNTLAKEFGKKKSAGKSLNIANYKDQILIKKEEIQSLESAIKTVSAKLDSILYTLPNSPEQNIPIGETEKENLEINK